MSESEKVFNYDLGASWKACARLLDCNKIHSDFREAWATGKKELLEMLGPTGRVERELKDIEVSKEEAVQVILSVEAHETVGGIMRLLRFLIGDIESEKLLVSELANNKLKEKRLDPKRPEKYLPAETKVSKYYTAIALQEGYITEEQIKKLQEKLSVVIEQLRAQKARIVVSINPLDILMASEHTEGWHSCHSVDGCYAAGPVFYALDNCTAIVYVYFRTEIHKPTELVLPVKEWRRMVYFDIENGGAFLMRQYKHNSPAYAKESRALVARVLAEKLQVAPRWKQKVHAGGDYFGINKCTSNIYFDTHVEGESIRLSDCGERPLKVYVGVGTGICPACGGDFDDNMLCSDCVGHCCYSCGGRSHEGAEGPDGEWYCENCISFSNCYNCDEPVWDSDVCVAEDEAFCQNCYDDLYFNCEECGESVLREDACFTPHGNIPFCPACFEEYFTTCSSCGDCVRVDDSYSDDISGECYCYDCWDDNVVQCPVCGKYVMDTTSVLHLADGVDVSEEIEVCVGCGDKAETCSHCFSLNLEYNNGRCLNCGEEK